MIAVSFGISVELIPTDLTDRSFDTHSRCNSARSVMDRELTAERALISQSRTTRKLGQSKSVTHLPT